MTESKRRDFRIPSDTPITIATRQRQLPPLKAILMLAGIPFSFAVSQPSAQELNFK